MSWVRVPPAQQRFRCAVAQLVEHRRRSGESAITSARDPSDLGRGRFSCYTASRVFENSQRQLPLDN